MTARRASVPWVDVPLAAEVDVFSGVQGLQNEALQQTRSALSTTGAALAAERRCSTDS
jgi:hypothetical protein